MLHAREPRATRRSDLGGGETRAIPCRYGEGAGVGVEGTLGRCSETVYTKEIASYSTVWQDDTVLLLLVP